VKQVQGIIKEGRRFAVDADLSKFFDRVNHDLLMTHLGRKIKDKRFLKLIKCSGSWGRKIPSYPISALFECDAIETSQTVSITSQ